MKILLLSLSPRAMDLRNLKKVIAVDQEFKAISLFSLSIFSFLYFSSFGYAQTDLELRMIQNFREAVVSKDQDKIHTTWMKLWERDDVVAYMKKNMPDEFLLYKSHRLLMRVRTIRKKYSGKPSQFFRSEFTHSSKPSRGGGSNSSNRTTVQRNPNQNNVSNNIKARISPNQNRRSNQKLMRNSINNSQRTRRFSNSRRYQRRQRPNQVK